jgi:OPT family small oligopeptide transporter
MVIGTFWGLILSAINAALQFRTNPFSVNATIAVLLSYPVGKLWAMLPHHKFFNPGPFSMKEHVLIFIIANSAGAAYGLDNVVVQRYKEFINNEDVNFFHSFLFVFATQFIGFGFAGLCRRFLVRPSAMWWPGNLSTIALFVSFHNVETTSTHPDKYKMSRYTFFWICFVGMFIYTFIPEFFAPGLQVISLLCFFGSHGDKPGGLTDMNLFASGNYGTGIMALTFDWQYITSFYVTAPMWSIWNYTLGNIIFSWILTPIWFATDTFGLSREMSDDDGLTAAVNTVHLFNGNNDSTTFALGEPVRPRYFYNRTDYSLNMTAYEDVAPLHISSYFTISYAASFLSISSVITHVLLWYGKDIKRQFFNAIKQTKDDVDGQDIHCKMMEAYPEVPDWVYLSWLALNTVLMIIISIWTPFKMPVWAIFLNLFISLLFIMPCGIIQAVSGQGIYLNVLTQMIIGILIPGDTIGVMSFKSLGTNNLIQALKLVSDLKLGHYLHIAPWAMVGAQMWGTFLSVVAGLGATWFMMFSTGDLLNTKTGDWRVIGYQTFYNAGAIWGAIAPARFWFALYKPIMWCFLVGFVSPFLPWLMNKYVYKHKYWHLINFPLIYAIYGAGGYQNFNVTPLILGYIFQVVIFKYNRAWYEKYTYVMGSAFDGSSALAVIVLAVFGMYNIIFEVYYPLNPNQEIVPLDYYCFANANYDNFTCEYYGEC